MCYLFCFVHFSYLGFAVAYLAFSQAKGTDTYDAARSMRGNSLAVTPKQCTSLHFTSSDATSCICSRSLFISHGSANGSTI